MALHVPRLFDVALEHDGVHVLQHATFLATAALFWWGLVEGRYGRASYGVAVLYVFATAIHRTLLGALVTFSTRPWYALHAERTTLAGVDPLGDQQLAGLVMWVPFGVLLAGVALALAAAWIAESERRAQPRLVPLLRSRPSAAAERALPAPTPPTLRAGSP
jgi:putative membrane protein